MARQVKLSHLDRLLEEFEYPVDRETVVEGTRDVTVELADGTENLGDLAEDPLTALRVGKRSLQ